MKLIKLSKIFKRELNHIDNYFVMFFDNNKSEARYYPFYIDSETFRQQINCERKNAKPRLPELRGKIIHVCHDIGGNRLYLPEVSSSELVRETANTDACLSVRMLIYKQNKNNPDYVEEIDSFGVVPGNPYSTFRQRSVGNFFLASSYIKQNIESEQLPFNSNLAVIEADLSSMPKTNDILKIDQNIESMFVGKQMQIVPFFKRRGSKDYLISSVRTPLILINISTGACSSETEKERIIVENYKKYFNEAIRPTQQKDQGAFIDSNMEEKIFKTKYLFLLGWSIKTVCEKYITTKDFQTYRDLLKAEYIIEACKQITNEGHGNPISNTYYYIVKRNKKFPPIKVPINPGVTVFDVNLQNQNRILPALSYDLESDLFTFKSKLLIPYNVCQQIFGTYDISILSYMSRDQKIQSYTKLMSVSENRRKASARVAIADIKQTENIDADKKIVFQKSTLETEEFEKRKISDFYLAAEQLRSVCKNSKDKNGKQITFDDLNIYLGPFSKTVGSIRGGYINQQKCMESNLPIPIVNWVPGLKFYPRDIIINTEKYTSVASVYDAIIHEYTHDINWKRGIKSPTYEMPEGDPNKMMAYLSSPDEIEAHIQQNISLLLTGMSKDQCIQRALNLASNEVPSYDLLSLAQRYNDIIEEAIKRLEETYGIYVGNVGKEKKSQLPPANQSQSLDEDFPTQTENITNINP